MDKETVRWEAEKNMYSGIVTGIVGREMHVLEAEDGELGYTKAGDTVYVARKHPLFQMIDEKEAATLRYGVCVHEALHQVFTNFSYMQRSISTLSRTKLLKTELDIRMYCIFVNLVEDPAIENMASSVIGGPPLAALGYTIRKIYELSGDFQKGCRYPIEEVINALIQFGDLGILKGNFSFQSARGIFLKIARPFYDAINEMDPKKRIDAVFPIYAECARLWAGYSEKKKEEMESRIAQTMEKRGKSGADREASGTGSRGTCNDSTPTQNRRTETMKRLEAEQGQGQSNHERPVADVSAKSKNNGDNHPDDSAVQTGQSSAAHADNNGQTPEQDSIWNQEIPEMPELLEKDRENILEGIRSYMHEPETNATDKKRYYRDFDQFEELNNKSEYRHIQAINRYASEPSPKHVQRYDKILHTMQGGIAGTVSELREIFLSDRVRKIHCESGRADMNRFASGRLSSKMFQKRRAQGHKADMCVTVIGDHSGSMAGEKLTRELYTVVALAEIFAELDIPFYFFSFHVEGRKPIQTHYIRWDNTETERHRLVSFKADGCNFDSYSIRYAAKLLEERPERHKLLFVLSDGLPSFYDSVEMGIRENTTAVMEARLADIDVIGFGIGTTKKETFHRMYGEEYYVEVKNPANMFEQIVGRLTTVVDGWD